MELINLIPDYIGWMLTGALWAFTLVAAAKVFKVFIDMAKERKELDNEED